MQENFGADLLDYLVNNAGHGDTAPLAESKEARFDAIVDVHFNGDFFLNQALLPLITDGGRIVNLSSGLTGVSVPEWSAYAAAKGAVEVLTVYSQEIRRSQHRGELRRTRRDRDRLRRRGG